MNSVQPAPGTKAYAIMMMQKEQQNEQQPVQPPATESDTDASDNESDSEEVPQPIEKHCLRVSKEESKEIKKAFDELTHKGYNNDGSVKDRRQRIKGLSEEQKNEILAGIAERSKARLRKWNIVVRHYNRRYREEVKVSPKKRTLSEISSSSSSASKKSCNDGNLHKVCKVCETPCDDRNFVQTLCTTTYICNACIKKVEDMLSLLSK